MYIMLSVTGYGQHPAAWRFSDDAQSVGSLLRYEGVVALAEKACLDGVLFRPATSMPIDPVSAVADFMQADSVMVASALCPSTSRIGLGITLPFTNTDPFLTARSSQAVDVMSAGRGAWLADLDAVPQNPADFGHATRYSAAEHYARADEFMEVALKLWDSWEDDAVIADKESGVIVVSEKVHPINHAGTYFQVRGPMTMIRAPQGRPVVVMEDATDEGLALAAKYADVFQVSAKTPEAAKDLASRLRKLVAEAGRPADSIRILCMLTAVLGNTEREAQARAQELEDIVSALDDGEMPCFIGAGRDLAAYLTNAQEKSRCDGFTIAPSVLSRDVPILVDDVVPALRERGLFRKSYQGRTLREHLGLPRPDSCFAKEIQK